MCVHLNVWVISKARYHSFECICLLKEFCPIGFTWPRVIARQKKESKQLH